MGISHQLLHCQKSTFSINNLVYFFLLILRKLSSFTIFTILLFRPVFVKFFISYFYITFSIMSRFSIQWFKIKIIIWSCTCNYAITQFKIYIIFRLEYSMNNTTVNWMNIMEQSFSNSYIYFYRRIYKI